MDVGSRRRDTVGRGFDDGLSQALGIVAGPVVFGLLGMFLDARLDTRPLCTIVLVVFGFVAAMVTQCFRYVERMRQQEEGKPWTRRRW